MIAYLDQCWAASLGCAVSQLRDRGRHVVAAPRRLGAHERLYPMKSDSIALWTCGLGWVLSVPGRLIECARELCAGLSFSELCEGDRALVAWYEAGGAGHEPERPDAQIYPVLYRLAESLPVRGWSHYLHWYCDRTAWAGGPVDAHVVHIGQDNPEIWEQWLRWPGPVGGPAHHARFEVSDAFGYVLDGQLVSAAQLFANVADHAWEFGPSTLPAFRCRGFATEVCRAATTFILEAGRIPWYYYDHYNRASARIPAKLGYTTYAQGLFSHNR